jgi:hypothetical protein
MDVKLAKKRRFCSMELKDKALARRWNPRGVDGNIWAAAPAG